jgi:type IV pilus assembly protein PilM
MEIFPKNLGIRPRLAVELRPEGIVAAKAENAAAIITEIAASPLDHTALAAGLRPGNLLDRNQVVVALREALDAVGGHSGDRGRPVTLVVPDATVRVLLLDFDALPAKPVEALAVIRFRLKKLLPFDSEHAALSYQVMATEKNLVRVLAVAMPREILEEYEEAVTAAGYRAGAVLPSTLATLAGVEQQVTPVLVVNVGRGGITTAIVHGGVLLLHRFLELADELPASFEAASASTLSLLSAGDDQIATESAIEAHVLASAESAMAAREVAQAVSVAVAYYEDTLASAPEIILSAGTIKAETLRTILEENGFEGAEVREVSRPEILAAGAATSHVSLSWLAGVRGALKS